MGIIRNKLVEMGAGFGFISSAFISLDKKIIPKWAGVFLTIIGFLMLLDSAFLNWEMNN